MNWLSYNGLFWVYNCVQPEEGESSQKKFQ